MALNPQQSLFKEKYTNPNSPTFGNATGSAVAAGYAQQYAEQILSGGTGNAWVSEVLGDVTRLQKAEKVLDKTLDFIDTNDPNKQRLAQDTAKFYAKGLGKSKYSERQEMTGPEGKAIDINLSSLDDSQLDKLITGIQAQVGKSIAGEKTENTRESVEILPGA